jgi:hypothetical protein
MRRANPTLASTRPASSPGSVVELDPEFWQTQPPYHPRRPLESVERRVEKGRSLRDESSREAHADWTPAPNRPDPVAILEAGNAGRQEDLIPLRMGRMAASPIAFLRGAATVMAWDLADPDRWIGGRD